MNCTHHRQAGSGEIVSIYHRIHNFGITFRNIINTGWKLKFSLKDVWCFARFGTMSFIIKLEKVLATVNKAKHLSSVNHTTKNNSSSSCVRMKISDQLGIPLQEHTHLLSYLASTQSYSNLIQLILHKHIPLAC